MIMIPLTGMFSLCIGLILWLVWAFGPGEYPGRVIGLAIALTIIGVVGMTASILWEDEIT
jgi:hypothetical protein